MPEITKESRQFLKDVHTLEGLPSPKVEDLRKASQNELAEEVITLRLFVGSLYLKFKETQGEIRLLAAQNTELEKRLDTLSSVVGRILPDAINEIGE